MNAVALSPLERAEIKRRSAKPLMWVGMVSIIMLFAGFTSAYIVRHAEGNWLTFELPQWFYASTVVIIASSVFMFWATRSAKKDAQSSIKLGVGITLLLGLTFAFCQFQAWNELVSEGIFLAGSEANASGSYLYVISGLHLAHVAGGLIALMVTLVNAMKERYNAQNLLGLQLCGMYWHFLGGLWIYLFLFLYLVR